jgi:hypothetical protein
MFGLLSSGFISLVTTPILFVFFRWLSKTFFKLKNWQKAILLSPLIIIPGIFALQYFLTRAESGISISPLFFVLPLLINIIYTLMLAITDRSKK